MISPSAENSRICWKRTATPWMWPLIPGDALCYGPSSPFHLLIFGVIFHGPGQTFSVHPDGTSSKPHSNSRSLSFSTDAIEERIQALNTGADDCLPKSFAPSEFLARVRALGRRSSSYIPELLTLENTTLDCSQYLLSASESQDPPQQQGISADGIIFPLSQ